MKKGLALILALLIVFPLIGCSEDAVLDEIKVYHMKSDIHALEIRVNAADFAIKEADQFSVESNLKFLTVLEENGVLKIVEEVKTGVRYSNAKLTLYVPGGTVFESASITTGAAKLTADTLTSKSLQLHLGAGDVRIESLNATSEVDIEGGAGKITINGGTLKDLDLEMGVGELNLSAVLLGDSDLTLGVGESNLTLIGSRDDYKVEIEKGIGSITVDGESVTDFGSSGNGQNHVQIQGGIGSINLNFQDSVTR